MVTVAAFGQGYFQFSTGNSQVWDGFTTPAGAPVRDSLVNVAFFWGAANTAAAVEGVMNGTPNNVDAASSTFSTTTAWSDILTDPNFTLAVNNNTSAAAIITTTTKGAIAYAANGVFPVAGTAGRTQYSLYMIGWSAAYATPTIAATAQNSYVGWSQVFQYSSTLFTDTPNTMIGVTPQFGVAGIIPEPTTMALAGLGGLSLLLFRRKK